MTKYVYDDKGVAREWITCRRCSKRALVKPYGAGFCSNACGQRGRFKPDAKYNALHRRVEAARGGRATTCVWGCLDQLKYEWANLTGDYQDVFDYAQMCKGCHERYDRARRAMQEQVGRD